MLNIELVLKGVCGSRKIRRYCTICVYYLSKSTPCLWFNIRLCMHKHYSILETWNIWRDLVTKFNSTKLISLNKYLKNKMRSIWETHKFYFHSSGRSTYWLTVLTSFTNLEKLVTLCGDVNIATKGLIFLICYPLSISIFLKVGNYIVTKENSNQLFMWCAYISFEDLKQTVLFEINSGIRNFFWLRMFSLTTCDRNIYSLSKTFVCSPLIRLP